MPNTTEHRNGSDRRQIERRKHPREEWPGSDRRVTQRRTGEDRRQED